jgi:transcriptional regulator with XRE-family HTH domain
MKMLAAATYLRTLREARGLSQDEVGRRIGVAGKSVYEWERGNTDLGATKLAKFIRIVQGSGEDIISLLTLGDGTEEEGYRVAQKHLSREQRDGIDTAIATYGPDVVLRAAADVLLRPETMRDIIREVDQLYETPPPEPKQSGPGSRGRLKRS